MEAEKRKKLFDQLKKNKYVLAVVLLGAVLILWPSGNSSDTTDTEDSLLEEPVFSLDDTEEKLAQLLSQIDGAGEVEVMLSLKTSTERIVAQDTENSSSQTQENDSETSETESTVTTVILSGDSGDGALTLVYIYPEYLGAVVIAEGAEDSSVKLRLTEAVKAATGLGTDKISVIKMKDS